MDTFSADTFQVLLTQPGVYEGTLVAASVTLTLAGYLGWIKLGRPWWEARTMKASREKETNLMVASNVFWMIKGMVKDGDLSVDEGAMYVRRFANCIPLGELLAGDKTLKEKLEEKHGTKEDSAPAEACVKPISLLKRLSNAKRAAAV